MSDPGAPPRGLWIDRAAIAAIVLGFMAPWWHAGLGEQDLAGHVALLASFEQQVGELGALPLWTSQWYGGASWVLAYLHPLFSLAALWPFAAVFGPVLGIQIGASVLLALAACAMHTWCLAVAGSRRGALLGALVYALQPPVVVFLGVQGHAHQPVSMLLVPLLFMAWTRLAERPSLARGALAALTASLLFLDMQRFWIVFPFALAVHLGVAWRSDRARAEILAVPFGVGLMMAVLLAFPALPGLVERAELQWHHPESIALYRDRYAFPGLFSLLDAGGAIARSFGSAWTDRFVALPGQWYQGGVALVFVAVGAVASARSAALAAALGAWWIALALSFGTEALLPGQARLAGVLADAGGATSWLVAALASVAIWLGVSLYVIGSALRARWPDRTLPILAGVALAAIALSFAPPFAGLARVFFVYDHIRAPAHFAFPLLGFALATAVGCVVPAWDRLAGTPRRATAVTAAVALLLLVDVASYRTLLAASRAPEEAAELAQSFRALRAGPPGRMLDAHHYSPLADWLSYSEAGREVGWGWLGWSSSRYTSDWIMTGFYGSLANATRAEAEGNPARVVTNLTRAADFAGLAHVRYVSRIAGLAPPIGKSAAWSVRVEHPGVTLYENRATRAFAQFYPALAFVSGSTRELLPAVVGLANVGVASMTLPDPAAVAALPTGLHADFWFGDRARALVPKTARPAPEALASPPAARGPLDACTPHRSAQQIVLRCTVPSDGYVVVAESWSPRWRVEVDGVERGTLRLNHAFSGVAVFAGETDLVFRYEPSTLLRVCQGVSALGIAILALYGAARMASRYSR